MHSDDPPLCHVEFCLPLDQWHAVDGMVGWRMFCIVRVTFAGTTLLFITSKILLMGISTHCVDATTQSYCDRVFIIED